MKEKKSHYDLYRSLITEATLDYDFEEVSEITKSTNAAEEIEIKTIKKGVFKGPGGHIGIFCKFINPHSFPGLHSFLTNKFEVQKIYEGEKYLLCLTDTKIFSYDIKYYHTILSIINSIDFEFPLEERKINIGIDNKSKIHVLVIETKIANFAIAGLMDINPEEEERVMLSNKLEASQPFFKFKSPIHFNWNNLIGDKDRQFERICELLLQKEKNIVTIIPIGKTRAADRGRDFEVIEKVEGINGISETKWLVQCKYSENSISPSTLSGWTDRVIEHNYHGFWLMTNNDITPNLFDQFKDVEKNNNYNIKVKFWQRSDFYIKLNVHSELFMKNDIFKLD